MELKHLIEPDNMSCVDFIKLVRKIGIKYWVPPPHDLPTLQVILDNGTDKLHVICLVPWCE
jgi:hypothetical protein